MDVPSRRLVARGVGKDFLQLLQGEMRSGKARITTLLTIGAILAIPAWLIWPIYGAIVHFGALFVGIGVGMLWGNATSRSYEDSLRGTWNRWMQLAPACDNVPELARKVRGRSNGFRNAWIAAGLTLAWSSELLLVILAFVDFSSVAFGLPVLIANGLVAGLFTGYQVRLLSWTRSFKAHLGEMVRDGELGVWGATA